MESQNLICDILIKFLYAMINIENLKDDLEVWYGYFYEHRNKVYSIVKPKKYLIKINKVEGIISLFQPGAKTPSVYIYLRNYGFDLTNTLYDSKEDISYDWNCRVEKFLKKFDENYSNVRRRNVNDLVI